MSRYNWRMTKFRLIVLLLLSVPLYGCKENSIVHKNVDNLVIKTFDNVEGLKCRFIDQNGFSDSVFINDISFTKSVSRMHFTVLDQADFVTSESLMIEDTEIPEVIFNTSAFPAGPNIDSEGIPQIVAAKNDISSEIVVRYWHENRGRAQFIKKRIIQSDSSQVSISSTIAELDGCVQARLNEYDRKVIVE